MKKQIFGLFNLIDLIVLNIERFLSVFLLLDWWTTISLNFDLNLGEINRQKLSCWELRIYSS